MATVVAKPATLDDFLRAEATAPEGTRLALIDGEIVEWGANMTTRNSRHSAAMVRFSQHLGNWIDAHPDLQGIVACGEARCRLTRDPVRIVGLDVAVFLGREHQIAGSSGDQFDGPPVIAIEILSSSDTHEDIVERIRVLLDSGVRQVWIVDAELRQVTIHRPQEEASFFTARQELSAEPELPGFRVPLAALLPSPPQAVS